MPLHFRKNQYYGVNAHLQSFFQAHGGWESFHTKFISYLSDAISDRLPPGYLVNIAQSLQIREFHPDADEGIIARPRPDAAIYRTETPSSTTPETEALSAGKVSALVVPVIATMDPDEDLYYLAIKIYRPVEDTYWGRPVTQIELLSPSNKKDAGLAQYRDKRNLVLRSGLRLVEVDFLHETPPPFRGVPHYPDDPDVTPYRISVSNPNPTVEAGFTHTYRLNIDVASPAITIPLEGEDAFDLDFGAIYDQTFASMSAYSIRVDYTQLPERFETYNPADQEHIRQVMARAASAPSA